MILLFPNFDTLQLALTSTIAPTDVTLAPARVSFDEQGKIYLETDESLSKAITKNLDRIGVKGSKRHATDSPESLTSWLQALPVTRDAETPNVSNQAPVLFELSDADDLPVLATEMLRLGNDRQSYRWFAIPGDLEPSRVLLRVIGPPYYTLLRALDKSAAGTKGTVRAYLERAPRAWVELGYSHPLATQIRVADRQLVLIRGPREWVFLDESPFQDIYDIMQFRLPARPIGWTEAAAPKKISVPLRLTAGNAADIPELWVLRQNSVQQLDALVRDSDERLTQRLMFAVATDPPGNRTVILRTRPSKLAPPHLALENALGYKPFWKLQNLFVPVGRRLHPTLRRDAVRKLLANDPDHVVWLAPDEKAGFTPESVPDGAFRPLEDWVDYIIESEQKPLAAWIEATRFDFDHFICTDTGGPKVKPDKGDRDPRERDDENNRSSRSAVPQPKAGAKGKPGAKASGPTEFLAPPEEVRKPSEWKIRRAELEKQFLEMEGGIDAVERQALWPRLARASAGIPEEEEAAICWLNAMWNTDPIPSQWLAEWARGEIANWNGTIKADEFDKRLALAAIGKLEARTLVASFLWLAAQNPVPAWLNARLPAIQPYLEKNEGALPVRALWLAGYRLAQLSGSDVLGLARVRDRLLNRLLTEGLSPEKDLPSFLRYIGHTDPERMRVVRERVMDLHDAVRKWTEHIPQNLPYVDLRFAFALAKLQEATASKKLIENASRVMLAQKPIPKELSFEPIVDAEHKRFLFKAFRYPVDEVLIGNPEPGQLSEGLLAELNEIKKKADSKEQEVSMLQGAPQNPFGFTLYVVDRMLHSVRIFAKQAMPDPYSSSKRHVDSFSRELAEYHVLSNTDRQARVRDRLQNGWPGKALQEVLFRVLSEALKLAARDGEQFTLELLRLVPGAIAAWPANGAPGISTDRVKEQGELIERALVLAGHYDRRDLVRKLIDEFSGLIHGNKKDEERYKLITVVGGQTLRIMKKLGMREEMDRFYTRLHNEILRGASASELKKRHANRPEKWALVLQTSLNLAGGWLSLGLADRAEPILVEARNELLGPQSAKLPPKEYTSLAQSYVSVLGQGPSETGIARIAELFRRMDPNRISNTWTTARYYSRFHLNLLEDVIRAIVSDDFALGPGGRKWLDDDEYLVRRRIHSDMKREREKSGL